MEHRGAHCGNWAILVSMLIRLAVVELDKLQAVPAPDWGRERLQLRWREVAWPRGLKGHVLDGMPGCSYDEILFQYHEGTPVLQRLSVGIAAQRSI